MLSCARSRAVIDHGEPIRIAYGNRPHAVVDSENDIRRVSKVGSLGDRVNQLIADGQRHAFAPAGRRFRAWFTIPPAAVQIWPDYLVEARQFVSASR
jgi:hypothetical protein